MRRRRALEHLWNAWPVYVMIGGLLLAPIVVGVKACSNAAPVRLGSTQP